jgi:hypothetical protein
LVKKNDILNPSVSYNFPPSYKVVSFPGGDEGIYFNTSYNIRNFNIASYQIESDRIFLYKNALKPPLYSFYLSLFLPKNEDDLNCLYKFKNEKCIEYLDFSKNVNYFTHIFHSLFLCLFIFLLTKNLYLSTGSFLLLLSSTYFLHITNYYLSEGLCSIILLFHSFCFYKFFSKFKKKYLVLSSITLALLILTKAIFIYWFYLIIFLWILLILLIKIRNYNYVFTSYKLNFLNFKRLVIFFLLVTIIQFPWQIRNFYETGNFNISTQGGNVLSERVEYMKSSYQELKFSFVWYLPRSEIRDKIIKKLGYENFELFDESNKNSHYRISSENERGLVLSQLDWKDKKNPKKVFNKSLDVILEDPIKHLSLSIIFLFRGMFLETDESNLDNYQYYLTNLTHWPSTVVLIIFLFIFIVKKSKKLYLIAPSIFVIIAYSNFTDFEPRYGSIYYSIFLLVVSIIINDKIKKYERKKHNI